MVFAKMKQTMEIVFLMVLIVVEDIPVGVMMNMMVFLISNLEIKPIAMSVSARVGKIKNQLS